MATRYWVGGTGTWDASSTTNWSATSGGAGGASAPVAADTVIFDSSSGTGICTTASGAVCSAVTFNTATVTLVLGANFTMGGTFTLTAGTLDINSYTLTCNTISSISTNARTLAFGSTGKFVVTRTANITYAVDTYNATTLTTITGTPTFEFTGNFSASNGLRSSNVNDVPVNVYVKSGTGTFNLASGYSYENVDFTGFSGTLQNGGYNIYGDLTLASGMIITAGTGLLSFRKTSGTQKVMMNGLTYDRPITINGAGGTVEFQDALTQGSTRAFTITVGTVKLKAGVTSTVGSFVATSASAKILASTVAGSQATLSQASGIVNANNTTIQDINATGGATWNAFYADGNIDAGNNTGWEFGGTPAVTTELTYRLRSFTTPRRF